MKAYIAEPILRHHKEEYEGFLTFLQFPEPAYHPPSLSICLSATISPLPPHENPAI